MADETRIDPTMVSIDALLARRDRRRIMTDQCVVIRDAAPVFDPVTGLITTSGTIVYAGRCWIAPSRSADPAVASTEAQTRSIVIDVDHAAPVAMGDVVRVTVSADPDLIGRRYVIGQVRAASLHDVRRLTAEEVI